MTTVALYATDTMADWEYAYLTAETARAGAELVIVGDGLDPVRSMGGMTVTPDAEIGAVTSIYPDVLVLPGGDTYGAGGGHRAATAAVKECLTREVPVAAICGATYILARAGLLDDREHTSNAPEFLAASGYAGAGRYRRADVVTDRGVTTATGLRPVPFTAEVMRVSGLRSREVADAWERLYTTANPADYARLAELTETSRPE